MSASLPKRSSNPNGSVTAPIMFQPHQPIAFDAPAIRHRGFGFDAFRHRFVRVVSAVERWWDAREAMIMLGRADGAMLKDLGITRGGIEHAVRYGRR
jgi:uncharacterized protein YjiS (DUF1127 family)